MITDPISNLRARVEGLIKELNSKYKGLIIVSDFSQHWKAFLVNNLE